MGFLAALNWLIANTPAFLRPAINWLVNGLRNITNYISERWNEAGRAVNRWLTKVLYWGASIGRALARLGVFATWLVHVRIPSAIAAAVSAVVSSLSFAVQAARDFASGLVAGVRSWVTDLYNLIVGFLADVRTFVQQWIDRIRGVIADLIRALSHVLQGPEVLATWLVAAMWRASLRFLMAQRDRIALWLTRESVAFTRWLATELEDIILRWL